MAFSSSNIILVVTVVAAILALQSSTAAATAHTVGDAFGWKIPTSKPTVYTNWSSSYTFTVGDTLEFNFPTGQHQVARVPRSGYDSCSTGNAIGSILMAGPATVSLNNTGSYYFICFPGHCLAGQKLAITVVSSTSGPAPSPSPSPSGEPSPSTPGGKSPGTSLNCGISLLVAALLVGSSLLF